MSLIRIDAYNIEQQAAVASAATVDLEYTSGNLIDISGTTTITSILLQSGHQRTVRFTGALTLTNGSTLVLPGAANITTAAGDIATFVGYADGTVRCTSYQVAAAVPPTSSTGTGAIVRQTSPTLITPVLGVATGTSLAVTGAIHSSSPTAGIGYSTGAGGAQTQGTSKATTVVSNTLTTLITMHNATLNAGVIVSFTFTNSSIAATDHILINHESGGTVGSYTFAATPGAGTSTIFVRNATAGNLGEAIVIRVTVIKAVSA